MKIFFFLFVCAITLNACTVKDDIPSTPVEISSNDNAKIQQLTLQIELLNKEYQSPKTRSRFFSKLLSILYSDACGYSFGRKYNLDYRISLICGAAASLISILAASDRITRENECKVQYLGDSLTNYEIIGNTHNEAITRFSGKYLTKDGGSTTTRTATSNSAPIKENEIKLNLIHNITTEVNECLAHYKTGDIPSASTEELPMAVQLELISFTQKLTEQNDIESVNQVAKEFLVEDTDALNLL